MEILVRSVRRVGDRGIAIVRPIPGDVIPQHPKVPAKFWVSELSPVRTVVESLRAFQILSRGGKVLAGANQRQIDRFRGLPVQNVSALDFEADSQDKGQVGDEEEEPTPHRQAGTHVLGEVSEQFHESVRFLHAIKGHVYGFSKRLLG